MRKTYLFMAAAAALTLAACSSENDILQDADQQTQAAAQNVPVAFDTYISSSSNGQTRATYDGNGPYTNSHLQSDGFGVFASWHEDDYDENSGEELNFMYDQLIEYDGTAWTYDPLVYWPNQTSKGNAYDGETDGATGNSALADELNKVSFFAYAPYYVVRESGGAGLGKNNGKIFTEDGQKTVGITDIVSNKEAVVPNIRYVAAKTPADAEDLLWGVAPYGGLKYTAVNGDQIVKKYGESLINLEKPDVNTKIKFLFQHALTGLRMSIVAKVDALDAGEDNITDDDEETRISVNYITIKPEDDDNNTTFATEGTLSLLNEGDKPNLPNWDAETHRDELVIAPLDIFDRKQAEIIQEDLSITNEEGIDFYLNPELFVGQWNKGYNIDGKRGVTRTEKSVFKGDDMVDEDAIDDDDAVYSSTGSNMVMFIPVLGDEVSFDNAGALKVRVTINYDIITKNPDIQGGNVVLPNKISKIVSLPKFRNGRIYNLKLTLGLTSVKIEAEAIEWTESGLEIDLPRNLD